MAAPAVAPGDRAGLDALEVDALVLPMFEGRAQPLGVAGHVDWRLSGRIARLVHSGAFTGKRGELVLMTALERVGASRVLLWGLGPVARWSEVDLGALVRVLRDAAVTSVAVALPTATGDEPTPTGIAPAWLASAAWSVLGGAPVLLLDAAARRPSAPAPPAPPA